MHIPQEDGKKLDYRATAGIFVGYSILTKQYIVYEPSTKILHHTRDVVFRDGKWYKALNAADKAISDQNFHRDILDGPKPTKKQPSECQMEEPSDINLPLDPPKRKKKS